MSHLCTLLWKCVRCLKAAGLRGDPAPLTEDGAHISARSSAHMQTMNLNLLSSLRPVIPTSCPLLNRPLAGVQKRLDAERGGENEGKAKPHLQPGTSPELNLKHFTPQKMWRGNWATWKKDLSYNWSQFFRTSKLRKRSEERREQPAVGGNSRSQDIYTHLRYLYFKWVFPFYSNSTLLHPRGEYCDFLSGVLSFLANKNNILWDFWTTRAAKSLKSSSS